MIFRSIPLNKPLLILAIFLAGCSAAGPVTDRSLTKSVPKQEIQIDYKGNLYLVVENRQLNKYDTEGKLLFEYCHPDYTGITDVDVSDPHKVVLFYKDQQKAVILDRTLMFLSVLDLNRLEDVYAGLLRCSEEGFYWIFNMNAQKLISVDEKLRMLSEGFPFYQEGIQSFSPGFMGLGLEWIVLGDPDNGILIFDHLATFRKKLPVKGVESLLTYKKGIYYSTGGMYYYYNPDEFEVRELIREDTKNHAYYAWDLVRQKLLFINKDGEQLNFVWEVKF